MGDVDSYRLVLQMNTARRAQVVPVDHSHERAFAAAGRTGKRDAFATLDV